MIVECKLPELGENIESGTVAAIRIKEGDPIEQEQTILELETDKAVVEVPSPANGSVKKVFVKVGDEIKVGQTMITVDSEHESVLEKVPDEEEKQADHVQESDKGDEPLKADLVKTEKSSETAQKFEKPVAENASTPSHETSQRKPGDLSPAAPSVRRFARELGIEIAQVPGSGPGGRIFVDDVKAFSKSLHQKTGIATAAPVTASEPLPDFSAWGDIERVAMNKVREKTARHLSYAWSTIPHVTHFDRADITNLEKLRKQYGEKVQKAGGKLTMTAILLKIVAAALTKFPQFNASMDLAAREIILKKYFSIGIAVDTDRGLLVPVIREVNKKSITDLSIELTQIAEKARNKKLTIEDMQGGNFTISNLGGLGGTAFTPVINAPEAAILGVARASMEQVYINDHFEPRLMLPLSLSYDHRIIDGADAARFTTWLVEALQQPFIILLEG